MDLRQLSEVESAFDRFVDSLLPVFASITWIVAIRLVNRWLPKDKNKEDDNDDEDSLPDLPVD